MIFHHFSTPPNVLEKSACAFEVCKFLGKPRIASGFHSL